uniref:Uncharacterized protein n=1 Tax=Strigamia maritima TaxID=126957 RepID=T1JEZ8_STRMM
MATATATATLCFLLTATLAGAEIAGNLMETHLGRCPALIDAHPELCSPTSSVNKMCVSDSNCNETDKCCFDGCTNICTQPIYSACEHQLLAGEKRARALETHVPIAKCRSDGSFESIQCDEAECWCIDDGGFELAGTRTNETNVNCSKPRPCSGLMCRMLCPYGFALDVDGCPLCQCRDPCSGVACPGSQKCHLEEVVCDSEPCPPIPSCKQARFLDSLCPTGEPLYLNEESQPFLCGIEANKPQCPPFFACIVRENMDYGTCCPALDKIEKPGKCPVDAISSECGDKCSDDSSCMGLLKCCSSNECGSHCVPSNSTACEQQRLLAELLSRNEKSDRGYVPECSVKGHFKSKQCSRNGLVCWCVDLRGNKLPRTMGPAENVTCADDIESFSSSSTNCDETMCHTFCEYGTKLDFKGCPTCDCADPCDGFTCPGDEQCVTSYSETCIGTFCPSTPECKSIDEKLHKPGLCPQSDMCVNDSTTCVRDDDCREDEKCCPHTCGSSCAKPLRPPTHLPTMCEYLRAYALSVVDSPLSRNLAYPAPQCTREGLFEPIQCADGVCWCVDEFGVELAGTRDSNRRIVDCTTAQPRETCMGLMCRLGCDYGFVRDDNGCPICECRNPCDVIRCPETKMCQMLEVELSCSGGFCPAVPQCVGKDESMAAECPSGVAAIDPETNETRVCDARTDCPRHQSCFFNGEEEMGICCSERLDDVICSLPRRAGSCEALLERWFYNSDTSRCESFVFGGCGGNLNNFITRDDCEKSCVVNLDSPPKSGACPVIADDEIGACAEECKNDVDCPGPQKCCLNGCGAHVCRDPAGSSGKRGQCPYLLPLTIENCDSECKSDYDCSGESKCCSNGCGLSCVDRVNKTGCEHARAVARHFAPSCRAEDGQFETVQCANGTCWCVDDSGVEFPGTRTLGRPNCSSPRMCAVVECNLHCEFGMQLDDDGCPMCACHDPCSGLVCDKNEQCRTVALECSAGPCPSVAMCLPSLSNPCSVGEPFRDAMTGQTIRCGVQGETCPSSHKCHLSPLGEFAVCCPKPREVCSQPQDPGLCMAAIPRWSFHAPTNTCQEFTYGGCGGNLNNFQTQADCRFVCPVIHMFKKVFKLVIARCNAFSGAWESIQCLPSLGLCWCVNRDGDQMAGSLVRGVPACSSRVGRKFAPVNVSSVCEPNQSVHVCKPTLCNDKTCLADPSAFCRIDPCDGCATTFYNATGHPVDCAADLTPCQTELLKVVNSQAWANLEVTLPGALMKDLPLTNPTRTRRDLGTETTTTPATLPELPLEALLMGVTLPQCTDDGAYSPTQTTGILSWCVTTDGQPIHESIGRGDIRCSPEGEVLERDETLDVCPNGRWKPRVCKDECLNAYCEAHPDAVCLADPCNNCKVSFISKKGESLTCEEKCSQPRVVGVCRASYRRYNYNRTTEQCEQFVYGGCGGNDNNFNSMEECAAECDAPVNVCEQPKRVGMCRASMRRWYFDQFSHRCEEFIFGGCDGNDNNFETREECEARCPDLVLCPTLNPLDIPTPCSRRAVCRGKSCGGRDDVVCTTDTCNECAAIFVDLDGNRVTCRDSPPPPTVLPPISSTQKPNSSASGDKMLTRCQKEEIVAQTWSQRVPSCDNEGGFVPTQCDDRVCWCVDQAGIKVPDFENFVEGSEICQMRKIEFVRVKLVFRLKSRTDLENRLIKQAMTDILEQIEAMTSDEIEIGMHNDAVTIKFVLVGDNNVDVAYALEEMVRHGFMRLLIGQHTLHALPNDSTFYHEVSYSRGNHFHFSAITVAAILVFTFLALLLICALIGGVMVYRKRRMGFYPRGSLESLTSSINPLYAYETKMNLDKKLKVKSIENEYAILNVKPLEKKLPIV